MLKKPQIKILDKNSSIFLFSGITIWCASVLGIEHLIYQFVVCAIGLFLMGVPFDGTKKFLEKSDQFGYGICSIVVFGTLFFHILTQTMFTIIVFTMFFGLVGVALIHRLMEDQQRKREKATLHSENEV